MKLRALSALIAGALVLSAQPGLTQQEWSFEGDELLVTNLIGEVTVRGHDGSRIIVRAKPGGDDAGMLDFEVVRADRAEFHAVFPLDESLRYTYPRLNGGRTKFSIEGFRRESTFLDDVYAELSRRDRLEVSGEDRGGLEVWVDLEILVPANVATRVRLAVGELEASDVAADIDLDTSSGSIRAENIRGNTRIDTGSGSVTARSIYGDLNIDTGSGRVDVEQVEGDEVLIDTGSGRVDVTDATARRLEIDTGSGSVTTTRITADNTNIDTGSGSVTLDLLKLDGGNHKIDTGSGGVTIMIPTNASVSIYAETGSGGINLDVPSARLHKMSRDEIELEIGDGRAQLRIDTGSGSVHIRSRGA